MLVWSVLALCAVGAVSGTSGTTTTTEQRDRRSTFLNIIRDRPSSENSYKFPVLPVELPIQLGGHGGVNLPVLVLPVPVPVYMKSDSCEDHQTKPDVEDSPINFIIPPYVANRHHEGIPSSRNPLISLHGPPQLVTSGPPPTTEPVGNDDPGSLFLDPGPPRKPSSRQPPRLVNTGPPPTTEPVGNDGPGSLFLDPVPPRKPPSRQPPRLVSTGPPPTTEPVSNDDPGSLFLDPGPPRKPPSRQPPRLVTTGPPPTSEPESNYVPQPENPGVINIVEKEHVVEQEEIPYSEGRGQLFATSTELIQSFRRETPLAPELPAVIPEGRRFPDRIPPAEPDAPMEGIIIAPPPPRPVFGRSLRLRIDLMVPRSDYTEVYDVQWHAESNTVYTEVEDGATIIYRVPLLDGRIQFLKIQEDRLNGSALRRCTMSPLLPASPADKTFPGLPDLSLFHFNGYTAAEGWSQVERWSHWVIGKPGEGGAARGEALNFSHDFFLYRDGGHAIPLKYTVVTHSSVLGPVCDSYSHRYRLLPDPTSPLLPDVTQCDVTEQLKKESSQPRDIGDVVSGTFSTASDFFNPIGEFLGLTRHPKYDSMFEDYKDKNRRNYRDSDEEAVRKQQFIKTNRFVDAANRIAVTFRTSSDNPFSDRLGEEKNKQMFGVVMPPPGSPGLTAPPGLGITEEFDFRAAENMSIGLPKAYDWRTDLKFNSPVRYQGNCNACWAFAVAGATEGARFNKTKELVPLSAQVMLDCGEKDELNCTGGWPLTAFGYVKDNGLPSWDDYSMYSGKRGDCKNSTVKTATQISKYHTVAKSADALKVAIYHRAPTVLVLRPSESFVNLKISGGVLDDTKCTYPLHAVVAVGWGTKGDKTHFTIKNSWSTRWGDMGYGKVAEDFCGSIKEFTPSYPVV